MLPDAALQVTVVSVLVPLTVAVNACWPPVSTVGF
jgi:hypothetical protein